MDYPLLSISCITYNHEPFIKECLEGFLLQKTNFEFEVLIHDDASLDNTANIIKEYEMKYPDLFRVIYQNENQYSKGVKTINPKFNYPRARGKYIALCEGDDYWTDPYKLQKQVDFLEANSDYDLVYSDIDFYYQKTKVTKKSVFKNNMVKRSSNFEEHLINRSYLAPPTWLFRKEALCKLQINEKAYRNIDGTFVLMLNFLKNERVYFMEESTAVYRILEESASHSKSEEKMFKYNLGVFDIQKQFIEQGEVSQETTDKILFKNYTKYFEAAIKFEHFDFQKEAIDYFKSKNIHDFFLNHFVEKTKERIRLKEDRNLLLNSYSYKLGSKILKPLKLFRK